jgi:hypothetical protein
MKHLKAAAHYIAYDNGMVNRQSNVDSVVNDMLITAFKTSEDLHFVNHFLSTLSDEDLETLCCGEEGSVQCPASVNNVLNAMFGE